MFVDDFVVPVDEFVMLVDDFEVAVDDVSVVTCEAGDVFVHNTSE